MAIQLSNLIKTSFIIYGVKFLKLDKSKFIYTEQYFIFGG